MSLENQMNPVSDDRKLSPKEIRELKRQSPRAKMRRRRIVCAVLALILLLLAVVPAYRLVYQPYQAKSVYRYMKTLYTMPGSGAMPKEYNPQLGALYDVNPDIGGWLIVPGSNINLPVVQTVAHDSVYYVNHLFDGTANPYGTPYFSTDCTLGQYGHNTVLRGGEKLMGELTGYRTLSYYQNAPLLFMDGINDTVIYKIFAIVDVNDIEISTIAKGQYDTPAEFHQFVTQMGNRSLINTGIMVEQQDSLLTVLCDTEKGKLAIIGRAVREGEDYTVDTSKATLNNGQNNVADWTVTATDWVTKTDVTATDVTAINRVNVQ
ncbi:MAG: class B sortase [Clostridia bacterium]|nr:class B sortase [Clostridia bacterium]